MLLFDIEAARTMMVVFAISIEIANVDMPFTKTQLLESEPDPVHQILSSSNFSLSLEWSLFKPFDGPSCKSKLLHQQPDVTDEHQYDSLSLYEILYDMCPRDQSDHLPVCFNLTLIRELNRQKEIETTYSETLQDHSDFYLTFSSVIGRFNDFDYLSQPTPPIISPKLHLDHPTPIDLTSIPLPNKDTSSSTLASVIQNVYLPLAGSDSDVLWYRSLLQAFLKNIVFSTFPGPWAEWINCNHPMVGITSVTLMYGSMLLPLVFACKGRAKNSKWEVIEKLPKTDGCCKDLVEVKKEKKRLSEALSDAKILLKRYVEIINSQKHELNDLNEAGAEFETQFFNVSNSLSSANYQILSYQEQVKKLEGKMKTQTEKLSKSATEHWEKMASVVKHKQELVMENELIERAKETTITCLTTLQKKFEKTKKELSDSKDKHAAMDVELCSMADKLKHHEEHLCKQEEEIEQLHNCLSQVTSQTAELASLSADTFDENVMERDQCVLDGESDTKVQLSNVQKLINGFQDEIELQKSIECAKPLLEGKCSRTEDMTSEIEELKEYVKLLEANSREMSEQLNKLQTKMKCIGDYFKSKEDTLHKTLAIVEGDLKQQKVLEFEAQEKLIIAETEIDEERQEWKDMKQQLLSINKSLHHQVTVSKDRADEALEHEKETRLELEQANEEIEKLKMSLIHTEKAAGGYKALPSAKAQTHLPVQRSSAVQKETSPCQPLHSTQARTSLGNQHSRTVLLNGKVSKPQQFFPLTQSQSAPQTKPILKHVPSKPSPLLKASCSEPIVQSDCSLKKSISLERKRSSPELSIPFSTHLPWIVSKDPIPTDVAMDPQCEMEKGQPSDKNTPHDISEDCHKSESYSIATETASPESIKLETTPSAAEIEQLVIDDMRSCSRQSQLCGHWD